MFVVVVRAVGAECAFPGTTCTGTTKWQQPGVDNRATKPSTKESFLSYRNLFVYQIIKVLNPDWMWRKEDVCILQLPVMFF